MLKRTVLLVTTLAGAVGGWGAQALAQTAAGADAAASNTTVGEVVVTAQRRSERLTDVPITVAVVTSAQLAQRGITDTLGLQRSTAGLQMPMYGSFLAPSIRGISANATGTGIPPNVALYVDGVYLASQIGGLMQLPDIEQIEILKGPQGTLYGQNAEAGAIVVSTLDPKFKWQGKASVSYGNYNDVRLLGFETGPITDSIAQSLSVAFENHDGFRTNIENGQREKPMNSETVRGKLLFKPNDLESITLTAYYSWDYDDSIGAGQPFHDLSVARYYDRNGNPIGPGGTSILAGLSPSKYSTSGPAPEDVRADGATLKGVFDVGLGKLTWLSDYNDVKASTVTDTDYSPLYIGRAVLGTHSKSIIEEGDFVSRPVGPVEFSTGLFYTHFEEALTNTGYAAWSFGPFSPMAGATPLVAWPNAKPTALYYQDGMQPTTRDILAAYIDGTFHATSQLSLDVGGRYSTDTMHAWYNAAPSAPNTPITPGTPGYVLTEMFHSPASWVNFAPRANIRYKLDPNSDVYFSYSEGYRSGTLNDTGLAPPPAKPETLDAYEVGYKASLFNRLSLNIAGFYYQYQNKQESIYQAPNYLIQNAASATNDGVDLDASWIATPQLTLTASVEWLEAKFGSYTDANVYVADPITGGLDAAVENLSHRQEERAPKWTGSITGDYHVNTEMGRFTANATVYYSSKELMDENGLVYQNPYFLVDSELGFTPAFNPNWRFVLWGKNLTNTAYILSELESPSAAGITYNPPRQFGARAEFRF